MKSIIFSSISTFLPWCLYSHLIYSIQLVFMVYLYHVPIILLNIMGGRQGGRTLDDRMFPLPYYLFLREVKTWNLGVAAHVRNQCDSSSSLNSLPFFTPGSSWMIPNYKGGSWRYFWSHWFWLPPILVLPFLEFFWKMRASSY